jgi:hypothetical protein
MDVADRDRWIEKLECPKCGGTGKAELSATDVRSWAVRVDSVSEGFRAIKFEYGSNFYCALCEIPVQP